MLTMSVLEVFDSIRQKHIALFREKLAFTRILSAVSKVALTSGIQVAPEMALVGTSVPDVLLLQTLLTAYDTPTNAHAHRIVWLAQAIADQLHLSDGEIFQIGLAALLHDIGKAGIPKAILNKRGPLDADEQQMMRRHPEIGQQMLLLAGGIFAHLAPIVVAHHENWDGGGYPVGLDGENIPLAARIIAVVDSYDAMTYRRAYHEPQSILEACVELQRCAGSRYDPHIVAAFLSLLDEDVPFERSKRPMHNLVANVPGSVGVMFATLSLQSGEYVLVSA